MTSIEFSHRKKDFLFSIVKGNDRGFCQQGFNHDFNGKIELTGWRFIVESCGQIRPFIKGVSSSSRATLDHERHTNFRLFIVLTELLFGIQLMLK